MTKKELEKKVADLEKRIADHSAAILTLSLRMPAFVPAPISVPNVPPVPAYPSPWQPANPTYPYIGDPVPGSPNYPIITCESNTIKSEKAENYRIYQ